jgi:hypothetical protein
LFTDSLLRLIPLSAFSSFYAFCVSGGVIDGFELADFAAFYGSPYFTALWIAKDARETHYWPAYHYGLWLFFLAPFLTVYYLLHTRGRSGIALSVFLSVVTLAPFIASFLGWLFYEDLPDFR